MRAPAIRMSAASFGYGSREVLRDIELTIEAGEFLGILGPNGAGKTTLFRGLLGLIQPRTGQVDRGHKSVGYVPQQEQLDPAWPLSVTEIIELGIGRRVTAEDRARAHANLVQVGLAHLTHALFASLSGGQRQRVLIARALMGSPEVLFLDEPTSGVDRPNQVQIMDLLGQLNADGAGPAVLIVSHEVDLLGRVARGALWVDGGRVERIDGASLRSHESMEALFDARQGATS